MPNAVPTSRLTTPRNYDGWVLCVFVLIAAFLIFLYQALTPYSSQPAAIDELRYASESAEPVTAQQVRQWPASRWAAGANPVNLGMQDEAYWFALTLEPATVSRILEINYPLLDFVDIHIYQGEQDQPLIHYRGGDNSPYASRPLMLPTLAYEVPSTTEPVTVLIRVQSAGAIKLPLRLWQKNTFLSYTASNNLMMGLFLGVLIAIGVSNFFLFITNRSATFFVYSGYVISLALLVAALHGIGYALFWPEQTWFQSRAVAIFANATIMFAVLFSDRILSVARYSPRLSLILKVLASLFFISLLVSFVLPYGFLIRVFLVMVSFTVLFTLSVGIWIALKGLPIARYYAFAWFILLMGAFTASLDNLGVVSSPISFNYLLMLGAGIETLLLALVLAINYSHHREQMLASREQALKQEKDMLATREELFNVQQKYQAELEYQVEERTLELEVALRELSDANQELENINTLDSLTGVRNRRHFDKRFLAESRRSRREQTPLSLAIIDIDHFKTINDKFGHSIGDSCLQQVAERLKHTLRRPSDDLCRYGGEEFVALLPNTDLAGAELVAETMRLAFADRPLAVNEQQLSITISIGVATAVIAADADQQALFEHADALLYRAKTAGRNRVVSAQLTG